MARLCICVMLFDIGPNKDSQSLTSVQRHTPWMEPVRNSTLQRSLCAHESAKSKCHLRIIMKTVLASLAP